MHSVFNITAPIFLIMGIGFALGKTKLLDRSHIGGFATFVLYLALPSLILKAFSTGTFSSTFNPVFIVAYMLGSFATLALGFVIYRLVLKKSFSISALNSFGGSISNSAFIGYPLLLQTFDHPPINAFTMILTVESAMILPTSLLLLELASNQGNGHSIGRSLLGIGKRLITNPVIVAIVLGILISTTGLNLPNVLNQSINLLAQAAAPVALVFIGATLASSDWHGKASDIGLVALFKLAIHPLFIFLAFTLAPAVDPLLKISAILIASVPMVSIFPVIGSRYGHGPQAASTLLVTTVAAFITISITLILLGM